MDIERTSTNYSFLHEEKVPRDNTLEISNAATAYQAMLNNICSPRLLLQRGECQRCLGSFSGMKQTSIRVYGELVNIKLCPVQRSSTINTINKAIRGLWKITKEKTLTNKDFPLIRASNTALERTVYSELENSWNLHCEEKSSKIELIDATTILATLRNLQKKVVDPLRDVEKYILEALNEWFSVQSKEHWHTQALYFLKLLNVIPTATLQDIARIACDPSKVKYFNPLLSKKSQEGIKDASIFWLELCTLEDKLNILLSFNCSNLHKNDAFIQELVSNRRWDSFQHPYWLILEVEQGIRIRPEQYEVAKYLIENNGKAVQLNMGLGKTRVILPMLILYFSFVPPNEINEKQIPRVCVPSTLFTEVCNHFSNALSASVTARKLFTLPFQRDVEIDSNKIMLLKDMVETIWRERGFVVMAPEHRLSLQLKVKELHQSGREQESVELGEVLSSYSWCDIIDEIDDVLHHRFQLVYSIGVPEKLPQVEHRWRSIQALLKVIKRVTFEGVTVTWNEVQPEAFPTIFLDESINISAFREHIVNLLFDDPPQEVHWLKGHAQRDKISHTLIRPEGDPNHLEKFPEEQFYDILSLRGFLAFDLLFHCLKKRHRVDYGLNKAGRKHLAVPYRGADTPSKRAEFSHPDCAMALTILAYYDDGLSKEQINNTFQKLLQKGRNSKISIYKEWLELSREKKKDQSIFESIDHVDKIDLTNSLQVDVLFNNFHKNPLTINFWLNTCVFMSEVDQYPKSMVANSWHLAHNEKGHIIGFSGTNDNHRILPLQLKQHLPWKNADGIWKKLLSTNGRMLDTLIEKTQYCHELQEGRPYEVLLAYLQSCWEYNERVDALIDSGALLAGYSNLKVAKFIVRKCLSKHNSKLKGVTFFDENMEPNGCWMILDCSGRCLPKDQSPFSEKETFAFFDEPRCRGVDLKLEIDAVALLTLGKNMCKDKFMQAAGRMRQLKADQRLIIVGEKKNI